MAMLVDTRKKETSKGFTPNVVNNINYKVPMTSKIMWFVLMWFPIGLCTLFLINIYRVTKNNWFKRMQNKINTASANIDVELKKRCDTINSLVNLTKSTIKWEKDVLTQVTALRSNQHKDSTSLTAKNGAGAEISKTISTSSALYGRLMATIENYPKLESVATVRDTMSTWDYINREIAANQRIYNALVNDFNQALFVFPGNIIAAKNGYYNMGLISASDEEKKNPKADIY